MLRRVRFVAIVSAFSALGLLSIPGATGVRSTAAAQVGAPDLVGRWTQAFEEGGAAVPRCRQEAGGTPGGYLLCKPAAANIASLPDGRILYYNGLEGSENVRNSVLFEIAPNSRNDQARILDLRGGIPMFTTPVQATGGGHNGDHVKGARGTDDPLGMAGIPGRPGDGLVGSAWGAAGGPGQDESASPDDHRDRDMDLFCADLTGMADGRVLIAGGIDWYNEPDLMDARRGDPATIGVAELGGLRTTRIFDPRTNSFSIAGDMHFPRWYPTLVALPDGRFLIVSGVTKLIKSTQLSSIRRTETFDPATNEWTENYVGPMSEASLPFQARLHLVPNGRVLYTGAGEMWAPGGEGADEALWGIQQMYDPASKTWEMIGPNPLGVVRDIPFSIMLPLRPPYDEGTVLDFGGALGPSPGGYLATPFSTLTTVTAGGHVTSRMTGNLNDARWSPSGVALPDGTVLAVDGARNSQTEEPGVDIAVRSAEIYDPATGRWTKVAPTSRDRSYHYAATLLADGRVLVGGASPIPAFFGPQRSVGGPFANNNRDPSFEVFSPPYLFRGPRPAIRHAPAGIAWGERFGLGVPDASDIRSVVLMRLPSQQHLQDSNSRTVELAFHATGPDRIEAVAPPSGVIAPPGAYYLFVDRQNPRGLTPSIARIVTVGAGHDPAEAVQPFPDSEQGVTGGSATAPVNVGGQPTYLGAAGPQGEQALGGLRPMLDGTQRVGARLAGVARGIAAGAPPLVPAVLLAAVLVGVRVRRARRRLRITRMG